MNQRLFSYPDPEVFGEGSFLDDVSFVGVEHQQGRGIRIYKKCHLSLLVKTPMLR
jgi:hypothetical protein